MSRIAASTDRLLMSMGMQPGGPLERQVGGRQSQYDIYNNVRAVGTGTAPGTAANRRARNPVDTIPFVFPRMHESVFIDYETIHNLRRVGGPASARDEAGAEYIKRQMIPVGQRASNWRTAMVVGMLRDSLYVTKSGANWYYNYTSSSSLFRVNFKMPTGNKTQLNMLGSGSIIDGSWASPGTNIPQHLTAINAAFLQLCGSRLERIICRSSLWQYVITNDAVCAQAGLMNKPFQVYERKVGEGPDGTPINEFYGVLACMPWVEWIITDDGLDIGVPGSETFTTHIESTAAAFLPAVNAQYFEMLTGSEPIAEYDNGPVSVKEGLASWTVNRSNPSGWEAFVLDNAMPCPYVPNASAYGTVIF